MIQIKKLYRGDYIGENVLKTLTWTQGAWEHEHEYAPNAVTNNQISNKAVVIGNGPSRLELYPNGNVLTNLLNHKGGLLAAGAIQTYGCNALYRDCTTDFLIASNDMANELAASGYCDNNIVYGSSDAVIGHPGKFYLVPQNPGWNAGAIATYLACFDGHKQVYLIGHDCHSNEQFVNYNVYAGTDNYTEFNAPNTEQYFILAMLEVMRTYYDVEFIRVMPTGDWYCPDKWKYLVNFRQIGFNEFVKEVDL